ncbi:hypothetical protein N7454_003571 [Penicillium verhagenii]|nr:hypothetical protein N7454_003571 [Penicillium verhagenii]
MASVTCAIHMGGPPVKTAVLNLDFISKHPSELTITEITGKCSVDLSEPSSPEMDTPRVRRIDPPRYRASKSPDSPTSISRPRAISVSRPTSAANSSQHSRSASRSTGRSRPPSRHSSFHSPRRPVTNAGIVSVPARTPQQEKRESLLALHRESCRLFQDPPALSTWTPEELRRTSSSAYQSSRRDRRTSSEAGTASGPPSPIASSSSSRRLEYDHRASISSNTSPHFLQTRDRANTLPSPPSHAHTNAHHAHSPSESSIHVPATVMEWTSDTTRRAEYEQIDRASRGVRGLWRRVAPRWCQIRDSRTPFFEEGKPSREGSVRRFRMDLPDEETEPDTNTGKPQVQILDFLNKIPPSQDGSRRLWTGRRSKTSPT